MRIHVRENTRNLNEKKKAGSQDTKNHISKEKERERESKGNSNSSVPDNRSASKNAETPREATNNRGKVREIVKRLKKEKEKNKKKKGKSVQRVKKFRCNRRGKRLQGEGRGGEGDVE